MERNILRNRDKLLGSDVADAITRLMDGKDTPQAVTKEEVASMLVKIASIDDDGVEIKPGAAGAAALKREYMNTLLNSKVFQSGYERYAQQEQVPIVPVTAYFFKHVYAAGLRDVLDAMTEQEIKQSLPRRESLANVGYDDRGEPLFDDEPSGKVYGIVIFPAGKKHATNGTLLAKWIERRKNVTVGQITSAVRAMEHAAPGHPRLDDLRGSAGLMKRQLQLSAPKVRDTIFD